MSDKSHTDLGTKEIYKRHSVMIEGGKMPRAKVMDQLVVDRMLMNGLLTLQEHQAAEYILSQAASAGVYAKPLNYEPKSSGGMAKNGPEGSDSPDRLKVLKKGLSWVADRRMAGGRNPVRHIRGK